MSITLQLLALWLSICCQSDAKVCYDRVCSYSFHIRRTLTMTYVDEQRTMYNVTLQGRSLVATAGSKSLVVSPEDTIVADGFQRYVITINGQFPGPTIEVLEGAEVVVNVQNMLSHDALTVHWHGMHQRGTNFNDGTPFITQCPVPPMQSFTYRFVASPAGTHWYHSHLATQKRDGLYGLLVVHKQRPTQPYYSLFVNDWDHKEAEVLELQNKEACENGATGAKLKSSSDPADCTVDGAGLSRSGYVSSMLGNRGRWMNRPFPLATYELTAGESHRFRLVNSGAMYPFEMSIDGHQLSVVASDGIDFQAVTVDSFFIFPGESIDFVVVADQDTGSYWMRADTPCPDASARAILAYSEYARQTYDPDTSPRSCTRASPCTVFNCPFGEYPASYYRKCIHAADARSKLSASELSERYGVGQSSSYYEVFLNFAMTVGASVNARRFAMPPVPLFQPDGLQSAPRCSGAPCADGCKCACTQILTLPFNETVQLVFTNYQPEDVADDGYHPIHIHGNNFAVLAQRFPDYNPKTGHWTTPNDDITCGDDPLCSSPSWSSSRPSFDSRYPPIKDTVVVPTRGYTVVRFRTTNPGWWIMHCHLDMHMQEGMTIMVNVAPDMHPKYPEGFPTCSLFSGSNLPDYR